MREISTYSRHVLAGSAKTAVCGTIPVIQLFLLLIDDGALFIAGGLIGYEPIAKGQIIDLSGTHQRNCTPPPDLHSIMMSSTSDMKLLTGEPVVCGGKSEEWYGFLHTCHVV